MYKEGDCVLLIV